jgi:hypothetical protein
MKFEFNKEIILAETIGIPRVGEFVRVGIPFAKGELGNVDALRLFTPEGEEQEVQITVLNRWNNGSIKWALIDFQANVPASGNVVYVLSKRTQTAKIKNSNINIIPGARAWEINTGATLFVLDAKFFRPFLYVRKPGSGSLLSNELNCLLSIADGAVLTPIIERIALETNGPLRAIIAINGRFGENQKKTLQFSSRLHFFSGSSLINIELTIRNPHRAQHRNGFWDLGDPGSLLFKELALQIFFPDGAVDRIGCTLNQNSEMAWRTDPSKSIMVYQESSGGAKWLSPTHRNRNGVIPFALQGYELKQGKSILARGSRATPVFWCGNSNFGVSAALSRFWQEFPKSIETNQQSLKIGMFPGCLPDLHEMQGGEQKTHSLYIDFCSQPGDLDWVRAPLMAMASSEAVGNSGALFNFPSHGTAGCFTPDLIDTFIHSPVDFFDKREIIDEYGWRNFGDVYADHEAVGSDPSQPLISHYNNQYDLCSGLYIKSFKTGDPLWRELAADLARHIVDIDIYHTIEDREEYNNGLFWHTNHYIDAGLSTHRSFSRKHLTGEHLSGGGGPGAEHCYTAGLTLHYFLTGDPAFRNALIKLAEWCYSSIIGSQTVFACVHKSLNYFIKWRASNNTGRQLFPKYPLTRGTGNAINACMDALEVSGDWKFLTYAEKLVRGCIHPKDDPSARDLLDAEASWSYTVLLASLSHFLLKLEELNIYGDIYSYAKNSLLTYAQWMANYEYPYLDKPTILEYPNETWPAQDLRKCVIFYRAARYAPGDLADTLLSKARFFYQYSVEELSRHASSRFARPLALILQNSWVADKLESPIISAHPSDASSSHDGRPASFLTFASLVHRTFEDLTRALFHYNPKKELKWLKTRLENKY